MSTGTATRQEQEEDPRRSQLKRARHELRQRSGGWLALARLAGAVAFLGLAAISGVALHRHDWFILVPALSGYVVIAAFLVVGQRRDGLASVVASAAPSLDVLVVFALQRLSLPLSPHPAGVAGWSLGAFVLLVVLASLTLRPSMIFLTAAVAWVCEAALQRQAEVGWAPVLASGIILALTAAVTALAARRLEELVARMTAEEVARRIAHERSESLAAAAAQVRAVNDELREKHAELVRAQARAESLSQLIVHDLKGPLTSILILLELTCENIDPMAQPRILEDLGVALREGKRLLSMVQDLLAIGRLEEGALRLDPRPHPLRPILDAIRQVHSPAAAVRGASLVVNGPADLSSVFDGPLIHRLIENLVVNALRFVSRGQRIEVSAAPCEEGLLLRVANDGPPISPEQREGLFQKQPAWEGPASRQNFGLGLTFCRLVAEAHGGRVALEDVPGWNVAFVVRLPRVAER
jgi:two-component system, OmpR family, heavy metal sensor histidine kinase CusS